MIEAGKLRHQVRLQYDAVGTPTSSGQPVPSWTTYRTTSASIEPMTGRAAWLLGLDPQTITSHVVKLRYAPVSSPPGAVLPKHRVVYGSRVFVIEFVRNIEERNRELWLACTELVPGA